MNLSFREKKRKLCAAGSDELRSPILLGESGAQVIRVVVQGDSWIEKSGPPTDIAREAAVTRWCAGKLPVAQVLQEEVGLYRMTELPGVPLSEVPLELASDILTEALLRIHAVPLVGCPFEAGWSARLLVAKQRVRAGLVDESDFAEANQGRSALDILKELHALPLPPERLCFTHGDATLENFLTEHGALSGIVDLGRAGIAHPAQDWALALRTMLGKFGIEGQQRFSRHIPVEAADGELLRRFCLLDELF